MPQVNDPARAAEIAERVLVMRPEYASDPEMVAFGASERLQTCALEFGGNGINIGSLSHEQWRAYVVRMVGEGNPDLVNDLLEGLTSWSQTDDSPALAPSLELPIAAEQR